MSPRRVTDRLRDIVEAIDQIEAHVAGMSEAQFKADAKSIDAVMMRFVVIGEAAAAIPDTMQRDWPQVPWALMRDMRNVMVHAYFVVDPGILWRTVTKDLPEARRQVMRIIDHT